MHGQFFLYILTICCIISDTYNISSLFVLTNKCLYLGITAVLIDWLCCCLFISISERFESEKVMCVIPHLFGVEVRVGMRSEHCTLASRHVGLTLTWIPNIKNIYLPFE